MIEDPELTYQGALWIHNSQQPRGRSMVIISCRFLLLKGKAMIQRINNMTYTQDKMKGLKKSVRAARVRLSNAIRPRPEIWDNLEFLQLAQVIAGNGGVFDIDNLGPCSAAHMVPVGFTTEEWIEILLQEEREAAESTDIISSSK